MDIEKLMEEVIDGDDDNKYASFIDAILDHWVYFFFNEKDGSDTKPGKGNVEVVLFTSKDNPILVPFVENEQGINGVLYTNSDLAIRSAEFNCKVGKMRGKNAFKMFFDVKCIDSIYIQGNYGRVRPSNQEFASLCTEIV